ncbi:mynd finger domain-like protein [Moniliophthora roreri]|nr:mynd finger domain-like protein [Moniliophthora roreri]
MSKRQPRYSLFTPPTLDMTELVEDTLDHDKTDMLIDKWLEHRGHPHDAYHDWFLSIRERKHAHNQKQTLLWNKGDFCPENVFIRTVDSGRLIPLDRTWRTHVYYHRSMQDRKLPMMPVVFTMLPELVLLRGMHDNGCDDIYIIVTDLKRQEMDDVTEYFKLVCRHTFGRVCKPSMERQIQYEIDMRITHMLHRHRRLPCFPQIDLTFRALLYEKRPRFLILFSHQTTSYSQILFTHPSYVPDENIYFDYPTGCFNPCCKDDCEMIRFPRRGLETAAVLDIKRGGKFGKKVKERIMCNWIDCDVCFVEEPAQGFRRSNRDSVEETSTDGGRGSTEGSEESVTSASSTNSKRKVGPIPGQLCSKCRLVRYCSIEHQKNDWEEHRRVCIKMT